jgi:hypothetical protein
VDAVRHAKHRLADARWFHRPPEQATAQFVERGLTVSVVEHGDRVTVRRVTPGGGADAPHPLAGSIPDDAVAAAAVHDGSRIFGGLSIAEQLERGVGLHLADLARAAPGDAVLFARPAEPVPTVTLIAAGRTRREAARVVADLAPVAPAAVPVTLDGVPLLDVALGPVDLYYGSFEDRTVVTDDADVKLVSKVSALAPGGLPDSTSAWAYLDVAQGLPALESLAALAGTRLSPGFVGRVASLRSLLVYRTHTATHQTLVIETSG